MGSYIEQLLERYGMQACNSTRYPMEKELKLERGPTGDSHDEFRSILGALGYACVAARPNIAYAMRYLSQFGVGSDAEHLKAVKL